MKKTFFTVGPSALYPTVKSHIKTAMRNNIFITSHRGKEFADIYKHTTDSLRMLMGIPTDYKIFFLGSATEAMERIIENTVEEKSFHLVNGAFSSKFYWISTQLGKKAAKLEVLAGHGFITKSIIVPVTSECICVVHNETSSGVSIPLDGVYSLKQGNKNALLAVDVVSSAPNVLIDFTSLDMVYFSAQKGFGLPSGLGVLIVSPAAMIRAKQLSDKGIIIGSYHNFLVMEEYARKFQTHETPNILNIYLLGKVCDDIREHGIENIRQETRDKAQLIYEYFDSHPKYKPIVDDHEFRSETVVVIDTMGETVNILSHLLKKGFVVSTGYGERKDGEIRIANFPSSSISQVKRFLRAFRRIK